VDQRRYYVTTPSSGELGPFNREELHAALEEGMIDRKDQVRTSLGKKLGAVSAMLRISSAREPAVTGFLARQPRSTIITLIALAVILVPLIGMLIALRATTVPIPLAPEDGRPPPAAGNPQPAPAAPDGPPAVSATAPSGPAAAGAAAADQPELGVRSGTVASILARQDAIIAIAATRAGGANHLATIRNSEVASNVIDGSVDSKYFNPLRDGPRPSGVDTGFVVTPSAAGVVNAFQIATANDAEGRDPLAITIEGSDAENAGQEQGNGFTLLYEGTSGLESDPGRKSWGPCVVFANRTAYRSYRVLVAKIRDGLANGTQYSEFRLGAFTPIRAGTTR
jgi:hypothetical protein